MTEKQPNLMDKLESEGISIDLPIGHLSILSNIDNINHALNEISKYSNGCQSVVGFDIVKSAGVRETNYRIFSQKRAEQFEKENLRFTYIARETILSRKRDIEKGKYEIVNGTIVGIN